MQKPLALLFTCMLMLAPRVAGAFCGFYVGGAEAKLFNNATLVVLMRDGTRTVLSMQNNYQGPPQNFAMIVPVPVVLQKENVKTLPREIFDRVDQLAAPRLVEYWEQDPCQKLEDLTRALPPMAMPMAPMAGGAKGNLGVTVEAQFTVGEYEVVILSAKDSTGLDTWLRREKYSIPANAEPLLKPYVQSGMKFFVAKVDVTKVKFADGMATLSPLRFHYDSEEFSLPIRLGLVNSSGTQDLIVHVLAKGQRYEVTNYPAVTIPTNIDVAEGAKEQFGAFYAALFDRTLEKNARAIVTEYAWDASTCDPCPAPALTASELATLGADVLPSVTSVTSATPPGAPIAGVPHPPPGPVPPPLRSARSSAGFVLTRLHARYGKETLAQDLVLVAAPPISGGREVRTDGKTLEHGSAPAALNNFQARYAIRHPWSGAVSCENPRRGIWGGPPAGNAGETHPRSARNTAFAPRGALQVATMVKDDVPELGIRSTLSPATPTNGQTKPATTEAGPKRGSHGCSAGRTNPEAVPVFAAGLFVIGLMRRRRRP